MAVFGKQQQQILLMGTTREIPAWFPSRVGVRPTQLHYVRCAGFTGRSFLCCPKLQGALLLAPSLMKAVRVPSDNRVEHMLEEEHRIEKI